MSLAANADTVAPTDPAAAPLREAAGATRRSVRVLRSALMGIYPPNVRRAGLGTALIDLSAPLTERGITAEMDVPPDLDLPADVEALLLRVLRRSATGTSNGIRVPDGSGSACDPRTAWPSSRWRTTAIGFPHGSVRGRRARTATSGCRSSVISRGTAGGTLVVDSVEGSGHEDAGWRSRSDDPDRGGGRPRRRPIGARAAGGHVRRRGARRDRRERVRRRPTCASPRGRMWPCWTSRCPVADGVEATRQDPPGRVSRRPTSSCSRRSPIASGSSARSTPARSGIILKDAEPAEIEAAIAAAARGEAPIAPKAGRGPPAGSVPADGHGRAHRARARGPDARRTGGSRTSRSRGASGSREDREGTPDQPVPDGSGSPTGRRPPCGPSGTVCSGNAALSRAQGGGSRTGCPVATMPLRRLQPSRSGDLLFVSSGAGRALAVLLTVRLLVAARHRPRCVRGRARWPRVAGRATGGSGSSRDGGTCSVCGSPCAGAGPGTLEHLHGSQPHGSSRLPIGSPVRPGHGSCAWCVSNLAGTDWIRFGAHNVATGETCSGGASV